MKTNLQNWVGATLWFQMLRKHSIWVLKASIATDTNSTVPTLDNLATAILHTHAERAGCFIETTGMFNVLSFNECRCPRVVTTQNMMTKNFIFLILFVCLVFLWDILGLLLCDRLSLGLMLVRMKCIGLPCYLLPCARSSLKLKAIQAFQKEKVKNKKGNL